MPVRYFKRYPDSWRQFMDSNSVDWIPFSMFAEAPHLRSHNIKLKIDCTACSQTVFYSLKKFGRRKLTQHLQLCGPCAVTYATNTPEWRRANSDAQLLVQSTAEQKLKNSIAVTKAWADDPERRIRSSRQCAERMADPAFKARWLTKIANVNPSALTGYYDSRFGQLFFGSSYELCWLRWAEQQSDFLVIRRCEYAIPYQYENVNRHYLPDYLVITANRKILVEVKSVQSPHYNADETQAKSHSTEEFIKSHDIDEYQLYSEEHPLAHEIGFKRTVRIKPLCKQLYAAGKLSILNKKKEESYIGTLSK